MAAPGTFTTQAWISDRLTAAAAHSADSVGLVMCGSSQVRTVFGTGPLVRSRGGRRERSGWGGWRRIFLDEKAACL